jgi:2-polyprenyl-3-methyl-5-hydroxy-6-metoxy-1,4-benzoquinol methylase
MFSFKLNNPFNKIKTRRYYKIKSALGFKKNTEVPFSKLLIGQQAGIPSEKWIEKTKEFDRISTLIADSPYVEILKSLQSNPELIADYAKLSQQSYYKMMITCLKHTGHFMGIKNENELVTQVKYFYHLFINFEDDFSGTTKDINGRSKSNSSIKVMKIKYSDCYEIIDGHHRAAIQYLKGNTHVNVDVIDEKFTYLQRAVLSSKQIFNIELYQPLSKPEVTSWPIIRNCDDRLGMMFKALDKSGIKAGSYIDLPCSYGYFVAAFKDRGFKARGLDIDLSSIKISHEINRLEIEIEKNDIIKYLETTNDVFDIVSSLSILHHFAMNRIQYPYMEIVKNLDKITSKVLFFDTGQSHEAQYEGELDEWTDEFIVKLFLENTSFQRAEILGKDNDNVGLMKENNHRTLFALYK